jgi:lysine 6-dehydrogenase
MGRAIPLGPVGIFLHGHFMAKSRWVISCLCSGLASAMPLSESESMKNTFAILGSGMQGTAAAYDLAKFADPEVIFVGDISLDQAKKCADRVNTLLGVTCCEPRQVDALNAESINEFLDEADVVLSCLPYWMHPAVADAAIETMTDMIDLGGNTEITMQTLQKHEKAEEAGITIVPDTGLAPGLVNSLGLYAIEELDETTSVKLYCGVLPQNPQPPYNYKETFNTEGLVTEYDYEAVLIRDGEVQTVDTLSELETIRIDELGTMEAFTTSGGTSTAPYTLQGQVQNYEYKTIRFPGHCALMRLFKDGGFWGEEKIDVKGAQVAPKDLFCKVFGEHLSGYEDKDQCAVRCEAEGIKDGRMSKIRLDIFDRQCEETGFTSMERLTGFSMAIFALEVVQGSVDKGCVRYENAMTGKSFVRELSKRGVEVRIQECTYLDPVN